MQGIVLDLAFLGLLFDDTLAIGCQVHGYSIAKKGTNFFDRKALGLGNVEVGDDKGDDTKTGVNKEHAPLAVAFVSILVWSYLNDMLTCFAMPQVPVSKT
jgi:hypothetical protein